MVEQLLLDPAVSAVTGGLEDVTMGHLPAIDMQGDRGAVGTAVRQRVVFERRNQAAGGSSQRLDARLRLEAITIRTLFAQVVLADFHLAVHDTFNAPDAGMIVKRRALA